MSQGRKVKMEIDIDLMDDVAQELGYTTKRNASVYGYGQRDMGTADLVVKGQSGYDVGFTDNGDGTCTQLADWHGGHVDQMLEPLMTSYYERLINNKSRVKGFSLQRKEKTSDKVFMYVGR